MIEILTTSDLAIFKTYPHLRKPMTDAFDFAWTVLKADLSQQLLAPEMVSRTGGGLAFSPYAESAERFMPQGAMHPAIGGMMERQGIQQPYPESYSKYVDIGRATRRDKPNPVQRMENTERGGSLRPQYISRAPTIEGPTFHGENRNYYGDRGQRKATALEQIIDPSLAQGSVSYPTTGSALPVGVTPYENVMQAM